MTVDIATPIAVSILVGGPFILIVVCIVACHLRRKRILIEEDEKDKDLEAGLNEDLLYVHFFEELQLCVKKKDFEEELTDKSLTSTIVPPINTTATSTPPPDSLPNGTILTTPTTENSSRKSRDDSKKALVPPADAVVLAAHNSGNSSSAFDFYDTMIPIMAFEESKTLAKPPNVHGDTTHSSNNSICSSECRSVETTALIKTLEALAALLNSPQFTKKLHIATYTYATPPRSRDSSYPSLPELSRPLALRTDVPSSLTSLSESIIAPTPGVVLIPEELTEPPKALVRESQKGVIVVS